MESLSHQVGDVFNVLSDCWLCSTDAELQGQEVSKRHLVGPRGDIQIVLLSSVKGEERLDGDLLFGLLLWSQISLYSLNLSQTKQENISLSTVPLIGPLGALKIHHEEEGHSCTNSDCL